MSVAEIRKAAVLLMNLSEEQAAELLAELDPRQVELVSAAMAAAENVTIEEQLSAICDFAGASAAPDGNQQSHKRDAYGLGSPTRRPDSAATRPGQPFHDFPLASVCSVDPAVLAELLSDERPQTIALVASRVPPVYGAALVAGLPVERQLAVIRAVATMQPVDLAIVREVAHALDDRIAVALR